MLKHLALCSALLLPAAPAWAGVGIGTTLGLGGGSFNFDANGNAIGGTANGFLPSLDLHFGDIALQIHVLEVFQGLANQNFFLGANVYFGIPMGSIGGGWNAIIAPGAGLDLFFDPFAMGITAESQFGLTLPNAVSIGLYIVPALGIWTTQGTVSLVGGGTLQMSIWWGGQGKGKGGGSASGGHPAPS